MVTSYMDTGLPRHAFDPLQMSKRDALTGETPLVPAGAPETNGSSLIGVELTPWDSTTWKIKDWRRAL